MRPVNRIPYEGPRTVDAIFKAIAEDAKKNNIEISAKTVRFIVRFIFSEKGALKGILRFFFTSVYGFGTFLPDPKKIKKREKYYREKVAHHKSSKSLFLKIKRLQQKAEKEYLEYLENSTAEIKLTLESWKEANKYKQKLDSMYSEFNAMNRKFRKRKRTYYRDVATSRVPNKYWR